MTLKDDDEPDRRWLVESIGNTMEEKANVVGKNAQVVYVWPEQADLDKARVVVYVQPRDWQTQKWRKLAN